MNKEKLPAVIIIGLSGAGKSTALQVFEDLKYITADGLPAQILPQMVRLFRSQAVEDRHGLAIGVEQLREDIASDTLEALNTISGQGERPLLLFLTASQSVILRRYSTTRRPHPLEAKGVGLEQAMQKEVQRLAPLREAADIVIDTSNFSIHDLRRKIQQKWVDASSHTRSLKVNIVSFGFKYGVVRDADMVFDLRFLPNPYFSEELRPLSGKDQAVVDFILQDENAQKFKKHFFDFLKFILPLYDAEGRYRITIAIGCTGGRHRSVAFSELLAKELSKEDFAVSIDHKHMDLG